MNKPQDDLSEKLFAWKVELPVPASFEDAVWRRIVSRASARGTLFNLPVVRRLIHSACANERCGDSVSAVSGEEVPEAGRA